MKVLSLTVTRNMPLPAIDLATDLADLEERSDETAPSELPLLNLDQMEEEL